MLARLLIISITVVILFPLIYKLIGIIQKRFAKPINKDNNLKERITDYIVDGKNIGKDLKTESDSLQKYLDQIHEMEQRFNKNKKKN